MRDSALLSTQETINKKIGQAMLRRVPGSIPALRMPDVFSSIFLAANR